VQVVLSESASAEAADHAVRSGARGVVPPVGGERVVAEAGDGCTQLRARDVARLVLFYVPDGHTKRGGA
jgi:hypothetical protein